MGFCIKELLLFHRRHLLTSGSSRPPRRRCSSGSSSFSSSSTFGPPLAPPPIRLVSRQDSGICAFAADICDFYSFIQSIINRSLIQLIIRCPLHSFFIQPYPPFFSHFVCPFVKGSGLSDFSRSINCCMQFCICADVLFYLSF